MTGTTQSSDFPTRQPTQALRGGSDAFLTILTAAGDGLAFSTHLGGENYESGYGISLDSTGATYVTGSTASANFPMQSAYQGDQGGTDAFVAKFEAMPSPPAWPVITEVANAWSGQPLIADAGWIYIKGTNLSATTRIWRNDEIVDGRLPKSLDGVSVKINGRDAYVYYVSPTQINVQGPSDWGVGQVPVQVANAGGTSGVFAVEKQGIAPALFVWPAGTATEGSKYVGALTTEGQQVVYIGKPGLLSPVGIPTRPARPGETVLLFATGCGPTTPPFPRGRGGYLASPDPGPGGGNQDRRPASRCGRQHRIPHFRRRMPVQRDHPSRRPGRGPGGGVEDRQLQSAGQHLHHGAEVEFRGLLTSVISESQILTAAGRSCRAASLCLARLWPASSPA